MNTLKLRCAVERYTDDRDRIEVSTMHDQIPGQIEIALYVEDGYCGVHYLDEDRARELFNWLGVWLHTPKA